MLADRCASYSFRDGSRVLLHTDGAFVDAYGRIHGLDIHRPERRYSSDRRALALLERAIELLRGENTLVIVDPAMADNGRYYANLGGEMTECFRRLIKKADIITPNMTEACFLTGMEYRPGVHDEAYVAELIDRLSELGPSFVAITGVSTESGRVGIVARDNRSGKMCSVMNKTLDGMFHGSGDVFASAFAALLTQGAPLEDALNTAEEFVTAAIERTAARGTPREYGLDFEGVLPDYIDACRKLFK